METSLRIGNGNRNGNGKLKSLRIHAKEKIPIDSNTHLQVHGALDTGLGVPTYCSALLRHFYPYLSASLAVGLQYNKHNNLRYCVRANKSFSVTDSGLLNLNIKGRSHADNEFTQRMSTGAAELCWSFLNVLPDQDVRLKIGYEIFDKVAYVQLRENNWTLNANAKGNWNVRFDL